MSFSLVFNYFVEAVFGMFDDYLSWEIMTMFSADTEKAFALRLIENVGKSWLEGDSNNVHVLPISNPDIQCSLHLAAQTEDSLPIC